MGKKVEVSYNPQLGYLQTVFKHDFDFLTGVRSYTPRDDGAELVADTYKKNTVKVLIQYVGETAVRFRMFAPGSQGEIDNSVYEIPGQKIAKVTENNEYISITSGRGEVRINKYPCTENQRTDQGF